MLPPVTSPVPPTAPTTVLVAPRPAAQEPTNGGARNITARAVEAGDESDETQEDSENGRTQRVDGKRRSSSFRRSFGFLGQYVDLLV